MEFEEKRDKVRVFLRTWEIHIFHKICLASMDRYSNDPHQQIALLGRIVDALGPDVSVVSIIGGPIILVETFCQYLVSG